MSVVTNPVTMPAANEEAGEEDMPRLNPSCHLCPGALRAGGSSNPDYRGVFAFDNCVRSAPATKIDFFALVMTNPLRLELQSMKLMWLFRSTSVALSKMFAAESGRSKVTVQISSATSRRMLRVQCEAGAAEVIAIFSSSNVFM